MTTVTLPKRGHVHLTQLGFGGAPIGDLYEPVSDDCAWHTVNAAWEAGVRYFDTAPHYGHGLSERRLGAALRSRPRDEWSVSTKVGRLLVPDDARSTSGTPSHSQIFDFSRDGVFRSLEGSLTRLGVDHVDVALVHDPDAHWEQASGEAIPALCELRDQGVVGAVGVGMNQSAMLTRFVERTDVDVVMCAGRYSLLEQPALADLLPSALRRRVGVLAAGVFNSGLLAQDVVADDAPYDYVQAPPQILARARALADACRDHGTSLPVAAVQFALAHPAVVAVVLGMGSVRHVKQDAALIDKAVPGGLWDDLVARGLLDASAISWT